MKEECMEVGCWFLAIGLMLIFIQCITDKELPDLIAITFFLLTIGMGALMYFFIDKEDVEKILMWKRLNLLLVLIMLTGITLTVASIVNVVAAIDAGGASPGKSLLFLIELCCGIAAITAVPAVMARRSRLRSGYK